MFLNQELEGPNATLERAEVLSVGLGGLCRSGDSRTRFLECCRGRGCRSCVVCRDGTGQLCSSPDEPGLDALDVATDAFELIPGDELGNAGLEGLDVVVVFAHESGNLLAVGAESVFHELDDGGASRCRAVAETVEDQLAGVGSGGGPGLTGCPRLGGRGW